MSHSNNINTLPDLCLLNIFDKLPLVKLLQVNGVCLRWRNLSRSATCRRRSLTLNIGYAPSLLITKSAFAHQVTYPQTFNSLSYENIGPHNGHKILKTLPNVKHLAVSANKIDSATMSYLIYLIENWTLNLVSVRVYVNIAKSNTDIEDSRSLQYHTMLQVINQMPKLRHLFIESSQAFSNNLSESKRILYFPVLEQLESFFFQSRDALRLAYSSLRKYGQTSDQLKKICFSAGGQFSTKLFERFIGLEPKLVSRISQFAFSYSPGLGQYELNKLCLHFTGLDTLDLAIDDLSLSELSNCLAKLKHLTNLGLSIDFTRESRRAFNFEDSKSSNEFSPLPSVKNIRLQIETNAHQDLNSRHLEIIFPKLEHLSVEGFFVHCHLCGYEERAQYVHPNNLKHCLRHLLASFGQCKMLQQISVFN